MTNNKPAVLISINPQWCKLIANGVKTVEVRKNRPKLETPFKCYIYCTMPKGKNDLGLCLDKEISGNLKKVGLVYKRNYEAANQMNMPILNGKVIGEFVCDNISQIHVGRIGPTEQDYICLDTTSDVCRSMACLSEKELYDYSNGKQLYGWHISNLIIYDEPKELSEFYRFCGETPKCDECEWLTADRDKYGNIYRCCGSEYEGMKPLYSDRPPQSWFYVNERRLNT